MGSHILRDRVQLVDVRKNASTGQQNAARTTVRGGSNTASARPSLPHDTRASTDFWNFAKHASQIS